MYHLRALYRVNNKRALLEVSPPIEIPSTPRSEIGQFLKLTGYSSIFTYFTWSRSIYNFIKILSTTIGWPLLLLHFLVLADYMKCDFCMVFCADLFLVVRSIKVFVKGNRLRGNFFEDSCIKWVYEQNNIYSTEI